MRIASLFSALTLGATLLFHPVTAATPATPFTDHMVLQRGFADPVWGTGDSGEAVTVEINGQSHRAVTGGDGKWQVKLDPMAAGGPHTLTIRGKNSVTLQDVMVGEVWVAGGQSNMARTLGAGDTAELAELPNFRYIVGGAGKWQVMTPASAAGISATAFYFGRNLHKQLGVPVGILIGAQGSSNIQRWIDPKVVPADPGFARGGDLFYGYLGPMLPYGVKGAIWYQGEADARAPFSAVYAQRLQSLIRFWRKSFDQPLMPFLTVQLPNFQALQAAAGEGDSSHWALIREGQRKSLGIPNTGMTVNIDIGDARNIHPADKSPFGQRLSLAARALFYGERNLVHSGPWFEGWSVGDGGSHMVLRFTQTGGGLAAKGGGTLKGFAIAGSDGKWVWADAVIQGKTVVVSSPSVPKPTQARYAWADNPVQNLFNVEGLPASPFRTEEAGPVALGSGVATSRARIGAEMFRGVPGPVDALGRKRHSTGG